MLIMLSTILGFSSLCAENHEDLIARRQWQGIPGIEITPNGRIFFTISAGTTSEMSLEYMTLLSYSDDYGRTHSPLQFMAPPKDGSRGFDAVPWIDPKGRLWYLFNRQNRATGLYDVRARISEDPDAETPVFGPEFRIGFDVPCSFSMNKPTVLSTGEWVMPVTYSNEPVFRWNTLHDPQLQGVAISHDEGKTWQLHGAIEAPHWALESMIVELKNGRLWMLIRTGSDFLWESFSDDKGITWSEGKPSKIRNPRSRFFIRRLSSGNLLMVNHATSRRRDNLRAKISTDDGKTWSRGLLLDARLPVSYPDGIEDKNGNIWIIYDFDRRRSGGHERSYSHVLLARFREEDAMRGRDVSGTVVLQYVINKLH
jgi:hypothetical protein